MTLRSSAMGLISEALTSSALERFRHRIARAAPVTLYYGLTDPYSYLALQFLAHAVPREQSDTWRIVVIDESDVFLSTDRTQWLTHAYADHVALAQRWHLKPLARIDLLPAPNAGSATLAWKPQAYPIHAIAEALLQATQAAWTQPPTTTHSESVQNQNALRWGSKQLRRAGHYQSGMLAYAGSWFGGLDRLHLLNAALPPTRQIESLPAPSSLDLDLVDFAAGTASGYTLDYFFSLRSPYSYLGLQPLAEFSRRIGAQLRLKPIFPMVVRGLKVPTRKRIRLLQDAARCARYEAQPFGPVCDPLGMGLDRALAGIQLAIDRGVGLEFTAALMHSVWSEALDIRSTRTWNTWLSKHPQWLSAEEIHAHWKQDTWRAALELNRLAHAQLGYWGVPVIVAQDPSGLILGSAWGHDRLWRLREWLPAKD